MTFLSYAAYFAFFIVGAVSLYNRAKKQSYFVSLFVSQRTICDVLETKKNALAQAINTNDPSLLTLKYSTAFEAAMSIPLYFKKKIEKYTILASNAEQKFEPTKLETEEGKCDNENQKYIRYAKALKSLSYSLHRKSNDLYLSVTTGIAKRLFELNPEMKTVCVVDGGTGYTRMYLYKNDNGTPKSIGEIANYETPSFSSIDIPSSGYVIPKDNDGKFTLKQKTMDEFIADFSREALEKMHEKPEWADTKVAYVLITGPLRAYWAMSSEEERSIVDNYIYDHFCTRTIHGMQFVPWNNTSKSCILSQNSEALMEYISVGSLIDALSPGRKCAGYFGIGCGSCQGCISIIDEDGKETTRVFEYGYGMKDSDQLKKFADFFERLFEEDHMLMDGFVKFLEKYPNAVFGFMSGSLLQVNANVMECFVRG